MKKLYVLVRDDLSMSQQAVQSGHAIAEFLFKYANNHDWCNGILVLLSVAPDHLEKIIYKAEHNDIKVASFYEPDLENQITAIAALPGSGNHKMFNRYSLL